MTHRNISFVKSGFRLAGYGVLGVMYALPTGWWFTIWNTGWGLLVLSEVIGVYEEVGE